MALGTDNRSFAFLHALHALCGYQACTALQHEEHEVHEDAPNLPLDAQTGLSFKLFMRFMVTDLVRLFTVSFMVRRLQTHDAVCELEILEVVAEVKYLDMWIR